MSSEGGPPSGTFCPGATSRSNWKVLGVVPPPPPGAALAIVGQLSVRFCQPSRCSSLVKEAGAGSHASGRPSASVSPPDRELLARGSQPPLGTDGQGSRAVSTPSLSQSRW